MKMLRGSTLFNGVAFTFAVFALSIVVTSCNDDYQCNQRYLATALDNDGNETELYYNSEGSLASIYFDIGSAPLKRTYEYDGNGRLIRTIEGNALTKYTYHYDANGNVTAMLLTGFELRDSIAIQYDEHSRVVHEAVYTYHMEEPDEYALHFSYSFEYPDDVTMKVTFFFAENEDAKSMTTYTFDGKKNPFPRHYHLSRLNYMVGIPSGNIVSKVVYSFQEDKVTFEETFSYAYNAEGYPREMKDKDGDVVLIYNYACVAPRE